MNKLIRPTKMNKLIMMIGAARAAFSVVAPLCFS